MMYQIILLCHVFIAVFIIALVLVQQGKGATTGAAFGSGASQTVFGSRGSGSFLFRVTLGFAAAFFATSIFLNNIASRAYHAERVLTPVPVTAPSSQTTTPVKSQPTTEDTQSVDTPVTPSDLPNNNKK